MPSTRLPVDAPPLVVWVNGLPGAIVQTQVCPPWVVAGVAGGEVASVGGVPLFAPLPPVLRRTSDTAPAARVTGRSKASVRRLTCERWAAPSLTVMALSVGAGFTAPIVWVV